MQEFHRSDGSSEHLCHRSWFLLNQTQRALANTKQTLTIPKPFDFLSTAQLGATLMVGDGDMSFAVSLATRMVNARSR
jgi:hypothetical protein